MTNRLPSDRTMTLDVVTEIPRSGPEIFILRLKARQTCTMTILSSKLFGINVHWNGHKSEPHYKEEQNCPGCIAKRKKRFKGFVHAFWLENGQEVFLELTPKSAQSLQDQLRGNASMRGNRVQVKRGAGDNGRLIVTLLTAEATNAVLPPEKDPLHSILSLWGVEMGSPLGGRELPTRFPSRNGVH